MFFIYLRGIFFSGGGVLVRTNRWATALLFLVSAVQVVAAPIPASKSRKQFSSLVVDVNGERRNVSPEGGLTVVRGDLVIFSDALTMPSGQTKFIIDLIGFNDSASDLAGDIGKVIDTAVDLHGGTQLKGAGRRFSIRVSGPGAVKREFFMILMEPELRSFDIEVNGRRFLLTDKDRLKLAPSDQVRILDVRTNIRGNENVKHDLVTKEWADGRPRKELRFSRGNTVFARIPIDWKGS